MSTTVIRMWLIRETEQARLYSLTPPYTGRDEVPLWVPKSIIEHTRKDGNYHQVTLPDWFVEREKL